LVTFVLDTASQKNGQRSQASNVLSPECVFFEDMSVWHTLRVCICLSPSFSDNWSQNKPPGTEARPCSVPLCSIPVTPR